MSEPASRLHENMSSVNSLLSDELTTPNVLSHIFPVLWYMLLFSMNKIVLSSPYLYKQNNRSSWKIVFSLAACNFGDLVVHRTLVKVLGIWFRFSTCSATRVEQITTSGGGEGGRGFKWFPHRFFRPKDWNSELIKMKLLIPVVH